MTFRCDSVQLGLVHKRIFLKGNAVTDQGKKRQNLKFLWFLGGAVYGVFLRYIFDVLPSSVEGPMSVAFLIGTPLIVGALTVYGHRGPHLKVSQMIVLPWVTTGLMLIGTALALLEGSICIAIMSPLFLLCASLGGLAMGGCLKLLSKDSKALLSVAFLPYLILFFEAELPLIDRNIEIVESVVVEATPSVIWEQILTAKEIDSDELPLSLTHIIGVPKPLEGVNLIEGAQEVRYSIWERGVNFKAIVKDRKENETISWTYHFDENSFPKGSMDDHVAIGGKYFDLHDTRFSLRPLSATSTQLTIIANYRITSAISFYAIPASKVLGRDFVKTILGLYKHRSEQVTA